MALENSPILNSSIALLDDPAKVRRGLVPFRNYFFSITVYGDHIKSVNLLNPKDQPRFIEEAKSFGLNKNGPSFSLLDEAVAQLNEYFIGKRRSFSLPLAFDKTTFRGKAWQVLQQIPFAETITYKEQAIRLNKPLAVRAVGQANAKNPFLILVPCHRVIGAKQRLLGFSAGLGLKKALLDLEKSFVLC